MFGIKPDATQVHVSDLVVLLMLVFRSAVAAEEKLITSSPYERYYIAGTRTMTYRELLSPVTKAMHRRGLISSDELAEAAFEDIDQFAVYASLSCGSFSGVFTECSGFRQQILQRAQGVRTIRLAGYRSTNPSKSPSKTTSNRLSEKESGARLDKLSHGQARKYRDKLESQETHWQ